MINKNFGELFEEKTLNDLKITSNISKAWISNPDFKREFIVFMGNILKEVYEPYGHWKKYKFYGVMDLPWENRSWSILNKINTNYTAISILVNEVNRALYEGNSKVPMFDFISNTIGTEGFNTEFTRFLNFLGKNKNKIFLKLSESDGSSTINKIIEAISFTSKIGDKYENMVAEKLHTVFGNPTDIYVPETYGEKEDMTKGIDISFNQNNIKKTIQVKKVKFIKKDGDTKYLISGTSFSKHYDVDYLVTCTYEFCFFFNYDRKGINILDNGDLVIDKSLLIKTVNF